MWSEASFVIMFDAAKTPPAALGEAHQNAEFDVFKNDQKPRFECDASNLGVAQVLIGREAQMKKQASRIHGRSR